MPHLNCSNIDKPPDCDTIPLQVTLSYQNNGGNIMFLIMGTGQGRKKLNFDQVIVCGHCGRNGHLEVYVAYSYFSLFFIPIIKWGHNYYVQINCCHTTVPISTDLGRQIQHGQVTSLPQDIIPSNYGDHMADKDFIRCHNCGYKMEKGHRFCPECGIRL